MSFDEQVVANIVKQVLSRVDMGSAEPNCAAASTRPCTPACPTPSAP